MPKQFVKDFKEGDLVDSYFMVKRKRLADFRDQSGQYLDLLLSDKTGDIEARVWDNAERFIGAFAEQDLVFIKGEVKSYKDKLQITVNDLRKCLDSEVELKDLFPHTEKDTDKLLFQLKVVAMNIKNAYLRDLLAKFFEDQEFVNAFKEVPASKSLHQAYIGGLIEHTCNVVTICQLMIKIYPQIDRDLLLTGAILHDIGKIKELKYERAIDYTDEGRLVGHVVLGERMVMEKIEALPDFSEQLKLALHHIILSHHGERQWGAPILPQSLEAFTLHYVENLDAKVKLFIQFIEKGEPGKSWTDYVRILGRPLYLGELEKETPKELEELEEELGEDLEPPDELDLFS